MDTLSTSTRGDLSPQKALKLAKTHLENAHKATDPELATMFYNEARAALSRMEQPSMETLLSSNSSQDLSLREEITYVLKELDEIMVSLRQLDSIQQAHTVGDDLRYVYPDINEGMFSRTHELKPPPDDTMLHLISLETVTPQPTPIRLPPRVPIKSILV
ncbi:hypothetical protein B0O80DRAFT_487613 [Mortierella sp. GBAus27b]|nr:hypothetical protein B0O80DRAFT_487613 [Mortierella sp. GBAus27b]